MQRITFKADADLLKNARRKAKNEGKTLNALFREWLMAYTGRNQSDLDLDDFLNYLTEMERT